MIGAVLIWGGSFIATKASVHDIPPVGFAVLRFAVATAGLLLVHLLTRTPIRIPRGMWGPIVWAGFLGVTATYALENVALKFTTAGNGALFIAASPLITIVGAVIFLREKLLVRQWLGAALATAGIVPLVGGNFGVTGLGDALMAINALVGVFYGLISKTLADRLPLLDTLTATFAVGLVGLLPCAAVEAWLAPQAWHFSATALGSVAYLGLGSSCLACWLWMFALSRMSASTVGAYLYGMPVVTLVLSAWMLHEPFGALKVAEAALILVGVYLAGEQKPAEPPTLADEPHV
jgi:drug/metabolite transporter (DMT)-like permease